MRKTGLWNWLSGGSAPHLICSPPPNQILQCDNIFVTIPDRFFFKSKSFWKQLINPSQRNETTLFWVCNHREQKRPILSQRQGFVEAHFPAAERCRARGAAPECSLEGAQDSSGGEIDHTRSTVWLLKIYVQNSLQQCVIFFTVLESAFFVLYFISLSDA